MTGTRGVLPEEEQDQDREALKEEGGREAGQDRTDGAEVETEETETGPCLPGVETLIETGLCLQTSAKTDHCHQIDVTEDVMIVIEDPHQEHQMQAAENQDLEETSQEADLWMEQDIKKFCINCGISASMPEFPGQKT